MSEYEHAFFDGVPLAIASLAVTVFGAGRPLVYVYGWISDHDRLRLQLATLVDQYRLVLVARHEQEGVSVAALTAVSPTSSSLNCPSPIV